MAYTYSDKLSALDASFLELESANAHMHVGAVALFDAGPLRGADGAVDIDRIRRLVQVGLRRVPRYQQRLEWIPVFQALGIALFSYNGTLYWGLNADWDALPDLHDIVGNLQKEYDLLRAAADAAPTKIRQRWSGERTHFPKGQVSPLPGSAASPCARRCAAGFRASSS